MLLAAIFFFVIGAIFGLYILRAILRNKKTPKPAVVFHGAFVILALLILVTYIASGDTSTLLLVSLGLFILAAIGGFTLFTINMAKKPIPKLLAVLHPFIAIIALTVLVVYAFLYFQGHTLHIN